MEIEKINKITEAEWFETRNAVFNPFYPARYSYPRVFHRSYVCEPRRNLNNGDIEFLSTTPTNIG